MPILLNFVITAAALNKYVVVFVTKHFQLYYLAVEFKVCFMSMINLL